MVITDLMEYNGQNVTVLLDDGTSYSGIMHYVPSWSEQYGYVRPHYFYIGDKGFKAHHTVNVVPIHK